MGRRRKVFLKDENIKALGNRSRYFSRSSKTKPSLPDAVVKRYDSKCAETKTRSPRISKVTFGDLPLEIKIKVLSYVSVKDIILCVAPVNREWYLLSRHPSLWRFLRFEGNSISVEGACRLLSLAPELKRLEVADRGDVDKLLLEVCRSNRLLEHLSVNNTRLCTNLSPFAVNFSKSHFIWKIHEPIFEEIPYFPFNSNYSSYIPSRILLTIVRSCQRLVTLNFVGMEIRSRCFFKELSNLPRLQCVDVNTSPKGGILIEEMATLLNTQIGRATRTTPFRLHALYKWCNRGGNHDCIPHWIVHTASMNSISRYLQYTMVVLQLDVLCAKEKHFELFFGCISLQVLHLDNARSITSPVLLRLMTSLHHLLSLRIHMACRMRATVFNSTFEMGISSEDGEVKKIPLKYLGMIGCNGLDDDSVYSIASFCPELEHLSLAQCHNITDEAVKWIIMFLHKLRSLDLWHCPGIVGHPLIFIPPNVPGLRLVVIDTCACDESIKETKMKIVNLMKEKSPHLRIHYSHSPPKDWIKLCSYK